MKIFHQYEALDQREDHLEPGHICLGEHVLAGDVVDAGPQVHQDSRVEAGQAPDNPGAAGSASPHLEEREVQVREKRSGSSNIMISTNQSTVSGRLPTNERGPLCHLAQPEHDGPLVLRHHGEAEDPGHGEQD